MTFLPPLTLLIPISITRFCVFLIIRCGNSIFFKEQGKISWQQNEHVGRSRRLTTEIRNFTTKSTRKKSMSLSWTFCELSNPPSKLRIHVKNIYTWEIHKKLDFFIFHRYFLTDYHLLLRITRILLRKHKNLSQYVKNQHKNKTRVWLKYFPSKTSETFALENFQLSPNYDVVEIVGFWRTAKFKVHAEIWQSRVST